MRIGLAYDLKSAVPLELDRPDDALEEYDSPETVSALAAAIEAQGHSVVMLGGGREFLASILRERVDMAFNISEGMGTCRGREAQVPSVLEMLNIPYSGSDPQCLAICLDKPLTKKLVSMADVRTPRWELVSGTEQLKTRSWDAFPFPAFVKPAYEGSSKGILNGCRVAGKAQLDEVVARLLERYRQPVLVEEYIAGDEITVGVVGNSPPEVVGIMRVLPKRDEANFVYSLEVKRDWEVLVDYECPSRLEADVLERVASSSLKAFEALGCRDVARVDFRLNREGVPFFLEINPLPGLNPVSGDLPIMSQKMGWTYHELIAAILDAALERYPQCVQG